MTIYCFKCGQEIPVGSKFCLSCGFALPDSSAAPGNPPPGNARAVQGSPAKSHGDPTGTARGARVPPAPISFGRALGSIIGWVWGGILILAGLSEVAGGSRLGLVPLLFGALCLPPVMRFAKPKIPAPSWSLYLLSFVLFIATAIAVPDSRQPTATSTDSGRSRVESQESTSQETSRPPKKSVTAEKGSSSQATPSSGRAMYVLDRVDVRLGPSSMEKITNTLYRQERVDVYETQDGWARISHFYDGAVEDHPGTVARWVPMVGLSPDRPADLPQPRIVDDTRIDGLPKVGENGLTKRDVLILQAAARYYLETGQAQRIEHGDKSISRPGVYYLNFGGPTNHFFRPGDIPDLERRIGDLNK